MNIDLEGRLVVFTGLRSAVSSALERAFEGNGADIAWLLESSTPVVGETPPFLLVAMSGGSVGTPEEDRNLFDEVRDFAGAIRGMAGLERAILVFSSAGLVPVRGFAEFSASQAGLAALTRTLGMELGPDVRVNGLAVGAFETRDANVSTERFISHTALRRPATLEEISAAALFLADPDNAYMTGHVLNVDGGWAVGYSRNF